MEKRKVLQGKKLAIVLVLVTLLSSGILIAINIPTASASLTKLEVDGTEIQDSYGNTVNLRGFNHIWFTGDSDSSWMGDGTWSEANCRQELGIMRDWNANVIRMPIAIDLYKFNLNNGGQYMRATVDKVLTYAEDEGLYIILEPHFLKSDASYPTRVAAYQNPLPYPPYQGEDLEPSIGRPHTDFTTIIASKAEFVNFMALLASTTKNHTNVLWGLWNEPQGSDAMLAEYYGVAQDCVDAIRDTGATQPILIMGENWGSPYVNLAYPSNAHGLHWFTNANDGAGFNDSTGNLIIDAHNYRGHITDGSTNCYVKDDLEDGLEYLDFFNQTYPIIVTETACHNQGGAEEAQYFDNLLTLFDEHGISYTPWMFSDLTSFDLHDGYPSCTPNTAGTILQTHLDYNIEPSIETSLVFYDGFELGNFNNWTGITHSGTATDPTITSASPLNGTFSMLAATTGGGASTAGKTFTAVVNATLDFYVTLASLPDAGNILHMGNIRGTNEYMSVIITNSGGNYYWGVRYSTTSTSEASASNPTTGVKYHIQLYRDNLDNNVTLTVDSVQKVTTTSYAITEDTDKINVGITWSSSACSLKVDDVSVYTTIDVVNTYTLSAYIISPTNTTYSNSEVNYDVLVSGNDTLSTCQINAYKDGIQVAANKTTSSGSFTDLTDGTYTFAVHVVGGNGTEDYETVVFSVSMQVPEPSPLTSWVEISANVTVTNCQKLTDSLYLTVVDNGTNHIQATISKTSLPTLTDFRVYVNDEQKQYTYFEQEDQWIIDVITT